MNNNKDNNKKGKNISTPFEPIIFEKKDDNDKKNYYTDINIGDRLRDIRNDNNFTQAGLAEKLGLTRSAVNSWEIGLSLPSTQYLIQLSKLYSVSIDYLLGLDEVERIDISNLDKNEKELIYGLLKSFNKINKTNK